jgi:hypothetical protein
MQREFRHLVMTNIRRIAHSPHEAQCIARLLLMQVILVCVAHAAQKTWMKGRTTGGDPGVDVMPEEMPVTATSEIGICEEDPAAVSHIRFVHCGSLLPAWESASTLPRPALFSRWTPASAIDPSGADRRILIGAQYIRP